MENIEIINDYMRAFNIHHNAKYAYFYKAAYKINDDTYVSKLNKSAQLIIGNTFDYEFIDKNHSYCIRVSNLYNELSNVDYGDDVSIFKIRVQLNDICYIDNNYVICKRGYVVNKLKNILETVKCRFYDLLRPIYKCNLYN